MFSGRDSRNCCLLALAEIVGLDLDLGDPRVDNLVGELEKSCRQAFSEKGQFAINFKSFGHVIPVW